jgi:hypothetical protein
VATHDLGVYDERAGLFTPDETEKQRKTNKEVTRKTRSKP